MWIPCCCLHLTIEIPENTGDLFRGFLVVVGFFFVVFFFKVIASLGPYCKGKIRHPVTHISLISLNRTVCSSDHGQDL